MTKMFRVIVMLRAIFLLPFALIFILAVEIRRFLFKAIVTHTELRGVKVISVGNITSGGTGKTPLVQELLKFILEDGRRVVVVSRAYRGNAKGPTRVNSLLPNAAEKYGDEPTLLASLFPQVPVYVGISKGETARLAQKVENPDVIVVDDGFQHLKLKRDVDILLVDGTAPLWHYLPIPAGYAREGLWSLRRANLVVVSKSNLPLSKNIFKNKKYLHMNYSVLKLSRYKSNEAVAQVPEKVLLVSGIARPETFESLVKINLSCQVVGHVKFADHWNFSDKDYKLIKEQAERLGAGAVLTTEKDAQRIRHDVGVPWMIVHLKTEVLGLKDCVRGWLN